MAEILLATLNARYLHTAFGLRYLFANLEELQPHAVLKEFTIQQSPLDIAEAVLAESPRVVGFGVYIWNVTETTQVVALLKRLRPELTVVLGGPEVSYEADQQPICQMADHLLPGEADRSFPALCRRLLPDLALQTAPALGLELPGGDPTLSDVRLPYDLYSDHDLQHRVVYVEASRGCPFTCEFCLSALEIPVRQFDLDAFLSAMGRLLDRGCRTFKFVDRTFNLNLRVSRAILQFFLDRYEPGLFLHFELIPDRLPESLKTLIVQFPPGALQFEVGIQTWNDDVSELISRRQDNGVAEDNLRWLREQSGVHLHTDLIVGLPGEDVASFARGFDRLVALRPQEIQVGILKRLRGTPIVRHDDAWQMVYRPDPPYEILQNRLIDFETMQELRRFAKTWDLVANSGNFVETTPWFWKPRPGADEPRSPFAELRAFSAWLYQETGRTHSIALPKLLELVFRYLTQVAGFDAEELAPVVYRDYQRGGRSDHPACLRPWLPVSTRTATVSQAAGSHRAERQNRWMS